MSTLRAYLLINPDSWNLGRHTIIISLINVGGSGLAHAPNDCNGDPPFTTPSDFSTPNEAYFAYAD
jgi:hypothetical protein